MKKHEKNGRKKGRFLGLVYAQKPMRRTRKKPKKKFVENVKKRQKTSKKRQKTTKKRVKSLPKHDF